MASHDGFWNNRKREKISSPVEKPRKRRRLGIMPLEPRIMYDGAAAATAAHHHHSDHHADHGDGSPGQAPAPATASGQPQVNGSNPNGHDYGSRQADWSATTAANQSGLRPGDQVVFVDSTIANYQAIVAAINPGTKVFVFDGTQDGLQQIAQDLQGVRGLASVDIITHGAADELQVGTDLLSVGTIPNHSADLAAIGNALAKNGQIDIYGCDVAAAGDGFIEALQRATGRNVAASTSPIGATALGGTWTLDATTGPTPDALPANLAAIQSFDNILETATVPIQVATSSDTVNIAGTATDSAGDIFVTGSFSGTVNFGLTSGASSETSLTTNSAQATSEIFVAKYSSAGVLDWVDQFTGTPITNSFGTHIAGANASAIAVSADGSQIAIGGNYFDNLNVTPTNSLSGAPASTVTISSVADQSLFLIGLNGSGQYQWNITNQVGVQTQQGLTGTVDKIAIDSNGNVDAAGEFTVIAGGTNLVLLDTPTGGTTATKTFTPASQQSFQTNFVLQASTTGSINWLSQIGNPDGLGGSSITALAVDGSNNVYVTSKLSGAQAGFSDISFGSTKITTADGGAYVAQFSSSGTFNWVQKYLASNLESPEGNSSSSIQINVIAFDSTGMVIAGSFADGAELNPASATKQSLFHFTQTYSGSTQGYSSTRAFVEQFTGTGSGTTPPASDWVTVEGGDTGGLSGDQATALAIDKAGNIVVGGYIQQIVPFIGSGAVDNPTPQAATSATFGSTTINYASSAQEAFVWDLTSAGATKFAGVMPSADSTPGNTTVVGLDPATAGGVVALLSAPGKVDADPSAATANIVGVTGLANGVLDILTPLDLGEVNAPTIGGAGNTVQFYQSQGSTGTQLDGGITVTDSSANIDSATVKIGSPLGGDTLDISSADVTALSAEGITVIGNGTATLTLNGAASATNYGTALSEVTYDFVGDPTNAGADKTRTISWSVTDANNLTSATGTDTTLDVYMTPVLAGTTTPTPTVTASSGAVAADVSLTVTDHNTIGSAPVATVTISGPQTGDELSILATDLTGTGITVAGNDSATLTLTGTASTTVAQFQNALDEVEFDATSPHNGTRTLTWSFNDDAGGHSNASANLQTMVDASFGPQITSLVGTPVNGGTVDLKGTGVTVGDTIDLYADGNMTTIVGTGTVAAGGTFNITTTATFPDGVHTFTAIETNSSSPTIPASAAFTVDVDPNAPVITAVVDQPVNGGTVELQGTGENGETVNLYADGNMTTIVGTGTVVGGTFDITTTATFADGVHSFTAKETDAASLTSTASTPAFTVNVDPTAPAITTLVGQPVNGGTVELKGTGETGETVNLYADGNMATIVGTGTVVGGAFDITTTAMFSDGVHSFTAKQVDAANLTSTASTPAFTVDVDPTAPAITTLVGQPVNGGTVELQGTGETGETVNLYADGNMTTVVGTGTVVGGTFDITTTMTFADGVHSFTAKQVDAANLTSTTSTPAFTVDVDPDAPAITALVGQPVNGGTVELQGTGETGETVNLYADGNMATIVGTGTVVGGTFDITTTTTFLEGVHTFTATETDTANLTSTASTPAFSIDVDPNAPAITAVVGQPVNGGTVELQGTGVTGETVNVYADGNMGTIVGTGTVVGGTFDITTTATFPDGVHTFTATETDAAHLTSVASTPAFPVNVDPNAPAITAVVGQPANGGTVELQGTGENGETVNLYADGNMGTIVGTGTVVGGTFDITTTTTFLEGVHTFTATETDAANLTSTASTPAFAVDVDPNAPVITAVVGHPINGGTIELQGTGVTGETVNVYADGNMGTIVGTGTVVGGTFDITTTASFADGVHTFTATETDATHLTSAASTPAFSVDVDPNAPVITTLVGQPVNNGTVELKGTGEAGETVNVYADGNMATIVGTGVVDSGGTFDITTSATFADGVHTFTAKQTDAANLTSTTSTPAFPVNVDPNAPVITALVGQPVDNGTVELQGTCEVGETINLYADGNMTTIVGTGVAGPGGTFDIITTNRFADGVHTFTATETDAAHLTSTASTPVFTVDVAPTLSIGSGSPVTYVQDRSPIPLDLTATADLGDPGGPLTGATVSIGSGFVTGDVLNFTNQNGITGNYDAADGVLTLTGSASVASYDAALDSITFGSTSPNPSNDGANPARTISWSVTDGNPTNAISATVTSTVGVQAVPTVVAGADVNFQGGPGKSVVLDLPIGAYDGTSLTGATVTIASGFQPGEVLSADTAGTGITASYNGNGVLTLSGKDTPQDYQLVLSRVTMSGSPPKSGPVTIDWQVSDKNLTSKVATSTVEVTAGLAPPPPSGQTQGQTPPNVGFSAFGDFSGMLTNVNAPTGEFGGLGFGAGGAIHVVHADVTASIGDNGNIAFNLPLDPLEAALDGDVVSVTASLPDGKPLPIWLQFNAETGKFAGLLPDDILTGSIRSDGGITTSPDNSVPPQSITIEVIARDSRGNMSIMDFTIDLSVKTLHKADKHGWNVLPGGLDPWGQIRPRRDLASNSGDGLHREFALPVTADHVLWHDGTAIDIDHAQSLHATDLTPAGRAGLSDQFKTHGWRAASAERMALLESLRQVATSWR